MKFIKISLFLLIFCCSCSKNQDKTYEVIKGNIDLRDWDFPKNGNVYLSGKWEFYWNQLLTPKDFETKTFNPDYIYVPQGWGKGKYNSKKYPDFGYATYRVKIILPKNETQYRILFDRVFSATNIYVNGKLLTQSGKIGKTPELSSMGSLNFDDYFSKSIYPTGGELELVIQMSNFDVNKAYAGMVSQVIIGTKKAIKTKDYLQMVIPLLVAGMLLAMSIYHFILFFCRHNNYATLVFALLSLIFFIRVCHVNYLSSRFLIERTLVDVKLVRAIGSIYILLMPTFFYLLFKKYFNKNIFKFIVVVAVLSFSILLFPTHKMLDIEGGLFVIVLSIILFLNGVAFRAMIHKEEGATWAFLGVLTVFLANAHDILVALAVLKSIFISSYAFAIYVLFQSINISQRFSSVFRKNIDLNKALSKQNKNLAKQHSELQEKNMDITDSIQYARTIQKAILPTQNYRRKIFPNSFLIYRPKAIVSGDFFWIKVVENMHFIACVDCTGHGVPGAFMSVIGHTSLNEAINHKYHKPSEILDYLNKKIRTVLNQEENQNFDGMDLSICRFEEWGEGRVKVLYAGAKSAIYLMKNNELFTFKGDRKSIGGMSLKSDVSYRDFEMELGESDTIYMASDGYIDQINEVQKRLGSLRFRELIKESHKLPIEEQKEFLKQELDTYQGNEEQIDDITVIGVRIINPKFEVSSSLVSYQ